jgi:hypothetical protein
MRACEPVDHPHPAALRGPREAACIKLALSIRIDCAPMPQEPTPGFIQSRHWITLPRRWPMAMLSSLPGKTAPVDARHSPLVHLQELSCKSARPVCSTGAKMRALAPSTRPPAMIKAKLDRGVMISSGGVAAVRADCMHCEVRQRRALPYDRQARSLCQHATVGLLCEHVQSAWICGGPFPLERAARPASRRAPHSSSASRRAIARCTHRNEQLEIFMMCAPVYLRTTAYVCRKMPAPSWRPGSYGLE